MTLLEILFATMILSVGLISVMSVFPLGVERHLQSVQDEKAAMIADSIKDAIIIGARYPYKESDRSDAEVKIVIVHDGMGTVVGGIPAGRQAISLPRTARPVVRNDDTGSTEGYDVKYEGNDPIRYPDQGEKEAYKLGQLLLEERAGNWYFNNKDDLAGYSFDFQVREAVTARRPRANPDDPNSEDTTSRVRVYELASKDHDIYEFTIRIYRKWRERSATEIEQNKESAQLVRVYAFTVSVSKVTR